MLTKEMIEKNKNTFIRLLREKVGSKRQGVEELINYLENESDFFTAPASTQYHCNYEGGLCFHSIHVVENLMTLCSMYMNEEEFNNKIDSIFLVALLHDISKCNYYESYMQNKKIYSPNGLKSDNGGKFDWVSVPAYKVIDGNNRFVASTHCVNSALIISRFIKMTEEETISIMNHHGGFDNTDNRDLTFVYNRYSLCVLLHMSDMISTYIIERV